MGARSTGYKILIAGMFLQPWTALAQVPVEPLKPLMMEAKYTVAWNGITIGRINLTAHEDAKTYALTVDTKTHGIATIFATERRIAEANGVVQNGQYIPQHYASLPQGKDEGRHTILDYDAHGQIVNRTRIPDDDAQWRAPVPPPQLVGVADSVTAGLTLRRKLYDALAHNQNEASVQTYDGARLAEMHFTALKEPARVQALGDYQKAVMTIVLRQPMAGYTSKEIKAFTKGDPSVHLYLSDDAKFIPLRATVSTMLGELSANLTELK